MNLAAIPKSKISSNELVSCPRCGKSTILWDYCHRAAMAGHRVVLVCLKKNDGEELTNLPRSMRAGRGTGKRCRA